MNITLQLTDNKEVKNGLIINYYPSGMYMLISLLKWEIIEYFNI